MMVITNSETLLLILVGSMAVLVAVMYIRKSASAGTIAATLIALAIADFVVAMIVGYPYPKPPKDILGMFMTASVITSFFALGPAIAACRQPTQAVVRSQERRAQHGNKFREFSPGDN